MTSCALCEQAPYPIEEESYGELWRTTNSWLEAEMEYTQRLVADALHPPMAEATANTPDVGYTKERLDYEHYLAHRLDHLNDEAVRRIKIARYTPSRSAVSQDTIKAIKDRLPLERVISQDRVLKKAGRLLLARCPWHEDAHPSLTIYPDNHWFCYSCQTGGDVFDWLMAVSGRHSFADALGAAAIMAGVELHPLPKSNVGDERALLT